MSYCIDERSYHCSVTEKQILKDLNHLAFDPQESSGYHGEITFHRDIVEKNEELAHQKLNKLRKDRYDDHAIFYKNGRKKFWLVSYSYHC